MAKPDPDLLEPGSPAPFDEVWAHLRQFMPDDFTTRQAIIVMDKFGWIDNGPCTCGLEVYDDPCPHHSAEAIAAKAKDCPTCGGLSMVPSPDPNGDVMNTPCPDCNPSAK